MSTTSEERPAVELVGRSVERGRLSSVADVTRRGRGTSLVLQGEAGIGKSALLDDVVRGAADLDVVRIAGVQSEIELDFAALHRLLTPYLARRADLPLPQRDALNCAFGLAEGLPADRFLVALAALTLLTEVATEHPLLCVIDDAQWIDRASINALAFVARRLHADRVSLIFSVRELRDPRHPLGGLPMLSITGLTEPDARALLKSAATVPIDSRVARRIVAETNGSPLALIELARGLNNEQLSGSRLLPEPLPLGGRLEAYFLRQVRGLSADAQTYLLLAAAETSGDPSTIRRAVESLGLDPEVEDIAIDALLVIAGPTVTFRHPLIRSAVYGGATLRERRRAHEALALATEADLHPDRRAWHRSEAAVGADEDVAEELERSAKRARSRGGYLAEVTFLVRAAELTESSENRARRLLDASSAAMTAGRPSQAARLLEQAVPGLEGPIMRAQAQRLDAMINSLQLPGDVPQLLLSAAKALEPLDVRLARDTYAEAIQATMVSCQLTRGVELDELGRAVLAAPCVSPSHLTIADYLAHGFATRFSTGYAQAVPSLRLGLASLFSTSSPADLIRWAIFGNYAALELWDDEGYRTILELREKAERSRGALDTLRLTLAGLGTAEMWAGRFAAADTYHSEAHQISVALAGDADLWDVLKLELMAWQGRDRETRSLAELLTGKLIHDGGAGVVANLARISMAVLENAQGNHREALAASWRLFEDDPSPHGNRALPEIVEAAVRCGEHGSASAALERLRERAEASGTPWALGLLARSTALLLRDDEAEAFYLQAIAQLGATSMVTEQARAHLLYGEWLSRLQRRVDAGAQLRVAHDMFVDMGAAAFAERARLDLAAIGEQTPRRPVAISNELTSQEAQIARLAAQGATNPEIAARIFISTSTVDYHLRKVYRKLGISSRRDLASALPR